MKLIKVLILSGIFFFGMTATAKSEKKVRTKTKAHQCAVFKKNAKKARKLYSANKIAAIKINKQVKVLKKDRKELPKKAAAAKNVVGKKIKKLAKAKDKKLVNSLKYLEKHIKYVKAAKRTCASHRVKKPRAKHFKGQDINKYLQVASN